MALINLVGKCGLYCGACNIYRAERDSVDMRKKIAENAKCTLEQVQCSGCGALTPECWGNGCKIVLCSREKGYDYCYECPEYEAGSCDKYEELYTDYLDAGVDLRENSMKIKAGEIAQWLKESEERFKCRACGKPLAVWYSKCHHCGKEK